jgi:hypothetical protein
VEVAHTALANYQAGRRREAYRLWRGAIVDSMFCGRAPGACIGTSELDGHARGLCTDFADTVGMFGRTLVEGLFGIVPDALEGELLIRPGLPPDWKTASIETPDVGYTYSRLRNVETYRITSRFHRPMRLRLRVAARRDHVAEVTVNGQAADWKTVATIGEPQIEITAPATAQAQVVVRWKGAQPVTADRPEWVGLGETFRVGVFPAELQEVLDPQGAVRDVKRRAHTFFATASGSLGHHTLFARVQQGDLSWWLPLNLEIRPPWEMGPAQVDWAARSVRFPLRNNLGKRVRERVKVSCGQATAALDVEIGPRSESGRLSVSARGLVPGNNPITVEGNRGLTCVGRVTTWEVAEKSIAAPFAYDCVDLSGAFNDRVTEIFKHEYRSPRSPYCSLQIPLHGYGDWCYCGEKVPEIDDSQLRQAAGEQGQFVTPQGIPFATPGPGDAPNVAFTSQWDNFPESVTVPLTGSARHAYFLVAGSTHPMHSQLDNGEILVTYADGTVERLPLHNPTTWWPIEADYDLGVDGFCVPGPHPPRIDLGAGRATLLDLPLDPDQPLQSLTVRCLANEVVVGLLAATLLRPAAGR